MIGSSRRIVVWYPCTWRARAAGPRARPARKDTCLVGMRYAIGRRCGTRREARQRQPSRPRAVCRERGPARETREHPRDQSTLTPLVEECQLSDRGIRPPARSPRVPRACENTLIGGVAECPAIPDAHACAREGACAEPQVQALLLSGRTRNDGDDAVDGVGAPGHASRTANDLDAVDVRHHHFVQVPEHSRKRAAVHGAAVDQHEQLVGERTVETADRHGPLAGTHLRNLYARSEPQNLGQGHQARLADIATGDDVDRRGHILGPLALAGRRRHPDVHQFFEGGIRQIRRRTLRPDDHRGRREYDARKKNRTERFSPRERLLEFTELLWLALA